MLHATHANESAQRRTVITLWMQPEFQSLPEKTQAQLVLKSHAVPSQWALPERQALAQMMPPHFFPEARERFPDGIERQLRPVTRHAE